MTAQFVGYAHEISVAHGDPLRVHVATASPADRCWADVYRIVGCDQASDNPALEFVERSRPIAPFRYAESSLGERLGPGDADVNGCGWPEAEIFESVPEEWSSGPYLIQFTSTEEPTGRWSATPGQDAIVIVRRRRSDPASSVLVQVGVATWNAYHIWQNRNLYIGDVGDPTAAQAASLRAHQVSFHRPAVGTVPRQKVSTFPPTAFMYLNPFVQWAREEEISVDYCAGTDIDRDLVDLDDYRLLVTLGHDEYWSRRQRDRVEAFLGRGGNAAFFGGNLAYWQIRLTDEGRVVQCYKRAADQDYDPDWGARPLDPQYRDPGLHPDHDNSDVTVEYHTPPLNRPTTSLTGVSMRNDEFAPPSEDEGVYCGAGWWWENFGGPARPEKGFTVLSPEHWAFKDTGIEAGATFGAEKKLIGFEADGLDVEFVEGVPKPTFRDGAPETVEILAFADCSDWAEIDYSSKPPMLHLGRRATYAAFGAVVTIVNWRVPGGGVIFTAPVTDWPRALIDLVDYTDIYSGSRRIARACPEVRVITRNVLLRLGEVEAPAA